MGILSDEFDASWKRQAKERHRQLWCAVKAAGGEIHIPKQILQLYDETNVTGFIISTETGEAVDGMIINAFNVKPEEI